MLPLLSPLTMLLLHDAAAVDFYMQLRRYADSHIIFAAAARYSVRHYRQML